jgi:hypothetical protein
VDVPTLSEYRDATLQEEGGVLGVFKGTVTLEPDLTDPQAARALISARLFDDEKLSGAYGAQYVWIPKWSDQRRTIQRGYRVRFASIFSPPADGSYRLQFYGFGQTRELPHNTAPSTVQAEVAKIDVDLADVEVEADPLGLLFHLPFRIGIGATAGRMLAAGGVGIALVNRDFSNPLTKGTRYLLSPRIPFETEDELLGLHDCINLALADIRHHDLLPVVSGLHQGERSPVVRLREIAPWLEGAMVTGFYAPTEWRSSTTFQPPVSGSYLLRPVTSVTWGTTPSPLPYNATGAAIEDALRAVVGSPRLRVAPQGVAQRYEIVWDTMHHEATIAASAGAVVGYRSERLRDPYPTSLPPSFTSDFEADTFSDPGYAADQSWFVGCFRPDSTRICPQTYPRRADGSLDPSGEPIPGQYWVDSVTGLVHDLDQARASVELVAPAALRYACLAIANVVPAGESARWEALAQRTAMQAAARTVYGKQVYRRVGTSAPWPPMDGSRGFFLP